MSPHNRLHSWAWKTSLLPTKDGLLLTRKKTGPAASTNIFYARVIPTLSWVQANKVADHVQAAAPESSPVLGRRIPT
jgi:hypothetical protein